MLPDRLRLAPHRTLLPAGATSRRIGLDPAAALVAEDLTAALALMLDELGAPVRTAALLDRVAARGGHREHAEQLLAGLLAAGAVVDARVVERAADRRRHAAVLVDGDGPLAAGVVAGLVLGGVGAVHVAARGWVGSADLGTGLVDADRGTDRAAAVTALARRTRPGADVGPPPERGPDPDLVVLADAGAADPGVLDRLHRDAVAHLPVRLRDGTGVVGPLVLPGRTPCLRCADREREDAEPGWSGIAAQLAGVAGRGDPACAAATAALGAAQALALLDGRAAPSALAAELALDVVAGRLDRRPVTARPGCGCGAPHARRGCAADPPGGDWGVGDAATRQRHHGRRPRRAQRGEHVSEPASSPRGPDRPDEHAPTPDGSAPADRRDEEST